jgi:hypothetical protein
VPAYASRRLVAAVALKGPMVCSFEVCTHSPTFALGTFSPSPLLVLDDCIISSFPFSCVKRIFNKVYSVVAHLLASTSFLSLAQAVVERESFLYPCCNEPRAIP